MCSNYIFLKQNKQNLTLTYEGKYCYLLSLLLLLSKSFLHFLSVWYIKDSCKFLNTPSMEKSGPVTSPLPQFLESGLALVFA